MENERGYIQWNHFLYHLKKIDAGKLDGPILDLGSGRGDLVYAGLNQGFDLWGVEVRQDLVDHFAQRLEKDGAPTSWYGRCVVYDGHRMPFENEHFSAVVSWYVLEHIRNLEEVLRETVRVLQRGGLIYLKAQDSRIFWEGHCEIPWLPFMPKHLIEPWLDEFDKIDKLDFILNRVFDFTMPQVGGVLEVCNCEIIEITPVAPPLIDNHWEIHTENDARELARKLRKDLQNGRYPEHLHPFIRARKL